MSLGVPGDSWGVRLDRRSCVLDPIHGGEHRGGRDRLQREHGERAAWCAREPRQREVRHDPQLHGHEELEEVRLGALVGLAYHAMDGDITQAQEEQEDRNCNRKPAAPMLQRRGARRYGPRHRRDGMRDVLTVMSDRTVAMALVLGESSSWDQNWASVVRRCS